MNASTHRRFGTNRTLRHHSRATSSGHIARGRSHLAHTPLDPPHAGARDQAVVFAASRVERIVAVSCNPATFARDARALADGGYRLERIKPIGQSRWSTHVELIAAFTR